MNRHFLAGLVLAVLLAGCSPKPRAPALMQGEAVYVNAQEGFRFLPPPNWTMSQRSEGPPGKLTEERIFVGYRRAGGAVTSLEVSARDEPESEDLSLLVKERRGTADWKPDGSVETLEVGGRPAARAAFQNRRAGETTGLVREVVAVRKGERVYYFTGLFAGNDAKAREQVRKSIETVSW
jgi:hypothetical protein